MKSLNILLPAVFFFVLGSCTKELKAPEGAPNQAQAAAPPNVASSENANAAEHVPNEFLVKFRTGTSESVKAAVFARVSGKVKEHIVTAAMKHSGDNEGFYLLHTPLQAMDAIAKARGAEVVYAEPNYLYQHDAATNDTYVANGSLWGMDGNIYGSQASAAWAAGHTGSSSVVVGVIDEGIQFNHPDLDGQIWTNPFDVADGDDNDGNGYIDDVHGWDFDGNNNSIYDGGSRGSLDDHGTHVSGTIGAKANNNQGVAGMNWNITIISAKFLGRRGGTTANAVKAVDYLNDLKTRHGLNIVASNNSWGGGGYTQSLHDAIIRSAKTDILFIAAAGNGGSDGIGDDNDAKQTYPSNYNSTIGTASESAASYDAVIAVAAISSNGSKSSFSNYGATTVDIGAPGSGVWSCTAYSTYQSYNGTSMATPHVTGAAALYAASHLGSSAATIKANILSAATPTSSLAGKCVTGGRLNVSGF